MILGTFAGGQSPRTNYNQTDPSKADYLIGRENIESHINDKANPHNVTIAQIGAAPRGYGLGQIGGELKDVTNFSELDSIIRNGWYFIRFQEPFYIDGVFAQFFCLEVCGETGEHIHQTIHIIGSNYKLHRKCDMGAWDAVEWENPPMQIGVEYRTTERCNGKVVYAKPIAFGAMPNNTTGYANHVLPTSAKNIRLAGFAHKASSDSNEYLSIDTAVSTMWASTNASNGYIGMKTYDDASAYNAYIIAKYTKD